MIRITFELLPGGNAERARTIGIMELCNVKTYADGKADYAVAMKKTPPFAGALRAAWRKGRMSSDNRQVNSVIAGEDEELLTAFVTGHHRVRRGVYDLLFRALKSCGLEERNH